MPTTRNDLDLYERNAADWWRADSAFAGSLHGVNALAIAAVRARLGARIAGARIVDLGCGGGLVSEPLARAGARVVGIDLGARSLRVARAHGADVPGLAWLRGDAADPPLAHGWADLVVCADVLEHVPAWRRLVANAARLLAPGGEFYVLTLNRTWIGRWVGVHIAETLRLVPPGTHDPDLFVRPEELADAARAHGLVAEPPVGYRPRFWRTLARWRVAMVQCRGLGLAYGAWFRNNG